MSLPRYGEYKHSGLRWLPMVPSHWDICALKRVASLKSGDSITSEQISEVGDYAVYGGNGLRGFTSSFTHEGRYALVGRQGALCGNVNYSRGRFWASEHAVVATPIKPIATTYLGELLRAMNLNQYSISAAQPGLSVELISNIGVPYPPLVEQFAIANFLDREAVKIDRLIAEQENLIALLDEKRRAAISQAVTKGLDLSAPMKDSGVVWLGEVPAHWELVRLGTLFRQVKRQGFDDRQVLSVYRDFGVIIKDSRSDNFNKTPDDLSLYQLVMRNDLVVNKMKGWQGSLGVSALEGITSPDYMVFSPQHSHLSEFIHFLLRSATMASVYRSISNGIRPAQWRMEPEEFLALKIPLPPLVEQHEIVAFCAKEAAKVDALTEQSGALRALLRERRSALVAAAVTGQIDVRGAVSVLATTREELAA